MLELQRQLDMELERLKSLRLQLAKKNRSYVAIKRQLDTVPDRTELAQYQRRFLELYNQGMVNFSHLSIHCLNGSILLSQLVQSIVKRNNSTHCTTRWTTRSCIWRRNCRC